MSTLVEMQSETNKLPSWIQWIGATTTGYALGMALSTYFVSNAMRPFSPILAGIFNVLIYGAIIGISLGIFQFAVMPRGLLPIRSWMLATLAGAAIGFAAASVVCEALGNSMDPTKNIVLSQGAVSATAGVIIGLAIGLGQWKVLHRRLPRMNAWIMASSFGTMVGTVMAAVLLGLLELPLLKDMRSLSVGAIMGIFAGIFQGLVFWVHGRYTLTG